jgi:hypothetical protein
MTDQQQHHPITPPPELKRQWREQAPRYRDGGVGREQWLIERAAQWGYDQRGEVNEAKLQKVRDEELEACCEWLDYNCPSVGAHQLRAARRPKPPSDKEQAIKLLKCYGTSGVQLTADQCNTILRALEDSNG